MKSSMPFEAARHASVHSHARLNSLATKDEVHAPRLTQLQGVMNNSSRTRQLKARGERLNPPNNTNSEDAPVQAMFEEGITWGMIAAGTALATGIAWGINRMFGGGQEPDEAEQHVGHQAVDQEDEQADDALELPSPEQLITDAGLEEENSVAAQRVALAANKLHDSLSYNINYANNGGAGRVPRAILTLLMRCVATAQDAEDENNVAPLIGPLQADLSLQALMYMPAAMLPATIELIDTDDLVHAAQVLKVIAARKSTYENADTAARASEQVSAFANATADMEDADLLRATSLRDTHGRATGLRQRYTNSCAPTIMQVMHGELDPAYALGITQSEDEEAPLAVTTPAAAEQRAMLGQENPPPIVLQAIYNAMVVNCAQMEEEQQEDAQRAIRWIKGEEPLDQIDSILEATELPREVLILLRGFYPFPSIGSNYARVGTLGQEVARATSVEVHDALAFDGLTADHMDDIDRSLLQGQPVPLGVEFQEEENNATGDAPGHQVMLVDIYGSAPDEYQYQLYEPTTGTSFWVARPDLLAGGFDMLGKAATAKQILT